MFHIDTKHTHLHPLVRLIRFEDGVISDSYNYRRQELSRRAIEREHGRLHIWIKCRRGG